MEAGCESQSAVCLSGVVMVLQLPEVPRDWSLRRSSQRNRIRVGGEEVLTARGPARPRQCWTTPAWCAQYRHCAGGLSVCREGTEG